MPELTQKQSMILSFIERRVFLQGYPPSIREIMKEFGLTSTNGVRQHLSSIEKKGYITRSGGGLSRNIKSSQVISRVPILGKVSAGEPTDIEENLSGYLSFGHDLGLSDEAFVVVVKDNGLSGAGIATGDHLIAEPNMKLESDDIVVAICSGEIILRKTVWVGSGLRLFKEEGDGGMVEDPKDKKYEILGRVVKLLRKEF